MPIEITMPRLSDTMERGTIVHWNVKEGDKVKPGVVLGDIETDKATMELQSFDEGTVAAILLPEGQSIDVGQKILVLAESGENAADVKAKFAAGGVGSSAPAKAPAAKAASGSSTPSVPVAAASAAVMEPPHHAANGNAGGRVIASPLAKKIAEERGVDLARVTGTGPSGRITRKDVESFSAEPKPAAIGGAPGRPAALSAGQVAVPAAPQTLPSHGPGLARKTITLSNMRRTIAARLVQSKSTIPHYQVTVAVAMDALLALRKQLNEQLESQGVKLSVNDFLVRACALAMHQHPHVNSAWGADGQSIELLERVNVGIAISLPIDAAGNGGGLVVATLRDADRMGLRLISETSKALAAKARSKGLTIEEMSDATFTISNLGMFGVEHFTAIINPPNAAILAVGAAVEKPVVRNGQIVVGHEMQMTMSSDHRIVDGAMAAAYLQTVRQLLESPATILV